jgi:hypothetical protein
VRHTLVVNPFLHMWVSLVLKVSVFQHLIPLEFNALDMLADAPVSSLQTSVLVEEY